MFILPSTAYETRLVIQSQLEMKAELSANVAAPPIFQLSLVFVQHCRGILLDISNSELHEPLRD